MVSAIRSGSESGKRLNLALGTDPPARADAVAFRYERLRLRSAEAVELRAVLAGDLEDVLEAARGDKSRAGAARLEERVRRHRHAVDEPLDAGGVSARLGSDGGDRLQNAGRLVARRRGCLRRVQVRAVEEDGVGEGSADVDP